MDGTIFFSFENIHQENNMECQRMSHGYHWYQYKNVIPFSWCYVEWCCKFPDCVHHRKNDMFVALRNFGMSTHTWGLRMATGDSRKQSKNQRWFCTDVPNKSVQYSMEQFSIWTKSSKLGRPPVFFSPRKLSIHDSPFLHCWNSQHLGFGYPKLSVRDAKTRIARISVGKNNHRVAL